MDAAKVNVNASCMVVLRARGVKALRDHYASLNMSQYCPKLDVGDSFRTQLWEIMHIFGDAIYMGPEPPFDTEIQISPVEYAPPKRELSAEERVKAVVPRAFHYGSRILELLDDDYHRWLSGSFNTPQEAWDDALAFVMKKLEPPPPTHTVAEGY